MLAQCDPKTATGARDQAIILILPDTGLRASEFLRLPVGAIDGLRGRIVVMGKGRKEQVVVAGREARSAGRRMLRLNGTHNPDDPLWIAYDLDKEPKGTLTLSWLGSVLKRLGRKASVAPYW